MDYQTLLAPTEQLLKVLQSQWPEAARALDGLSAERDYVQLWSLASRAIGCTDGELGDRIAVALNLARANALEARREALEALPFMFCQQAGMLPLRLEGRGLALAVSNPFDTEAIDKARFMSGRTLTLCLATPREVAAAAAAAHGRAAEAEADAQSDNAIIQLARDLFRQAIAGRASDLHIQPHMGAVAVRIRVDGELRRLTLLSQSVGVTLIRHIKARAGMNSTNSLAPQDGRLSMQVDGRDFDLRLSVLPASQGERLVARFLDQSRVIRLANSHFSLAALQSLRRVTAQPSGLLIFTGPTGSGKTSSLYGMLSELNKGTVNIMTVEDPVEYRIAGISQVEVHERQGTSFAAALRAILRQDPDVVLIGEIRDAETAQIAVQAAMTGHLVLTTLHTNDALSAIPRLVNLGVEPAILADALGAVASQRLCRSLCLQCRVPVTEPLQVEEALFQQATRALPAYRAVGCEACGGTGFRGRLPIVEIVENNPRLRACIAAGRIGVNDLEPLREGGLRGLAVSGALRIISGETTVREVMHAVGRTFWPELAARYGTGFVPDESAAQALFTGASPAVLMIGRQSAMAAPLAAELEPLGMRLVEARTPDEAAQVLRADEEVVFVVIDLGDSQDLNALKGDLALARRLGAWARLPALVLVPPALKDREDDLRAEGLMSEVMAADARPGDVVKALRRSQVR